MKSSSVSPGKPTISDVRRAIAGISRRSFAIRSADFLLAAPAVHSLQNRVADMLERDVQIFADFLLFLDQLDQAVGYAVGIGIEQAYPAQALDFRQPADQVSRVERPSRSLRSW